MLMNGPQLILYVTRDAAVLYAKQRAAAKLPLAGLVQNLEVADPAVLTDRLTELLNRAGARNTRLLAVLGDSTVFTATFPRTSGHQDELNVGGFKAKVPFEPERKLFAQVTTHDQLVVFGAGRGLADAVRAAADRAGAHLLGVVPAPAYGLQEPKEGADQLTPTQLSRLGAHKRLREQANFYQIP